MATNALQQSTLNKSRVDKFKMVFTLPPALQKINTHTDRKSSTVIQDAIQFSIYGTVVPELTVPALEIRYGGSTLYNSTHSRSPFPPVTVNFTVDNSYNNYWVIYSWLNLLHDEKTGTFDKRNLITDDRFKDYQADLTVFGLDEYDNKRVQFTYKRAFPTILGGINYNYREAEEIQSSFTFVYSQLHTKLINY
jgi:hypothetical protein